MAFLISKKEVDLLLFSWELSPSIVVTSDVPIGLVATFGRSVNWGMLGYNLAISMELWAFPEWDEGLLTNQLCSKFM